MINRILAATTATLIATGTAALAQGVAPIATGVTYENGMATTDREMINRAAAVNPATADAVISDTTSLDPVIIQGGKVVSATQPLDMELTPVAGTSHAFTNGAGQVVIVVPRGQEITVVTR